MSKVLVTGFDPFGGETVNPAYEAVKQLPDEIEGAQVVKLELPTSFQGSAQKLEQAMRQHQPDIVICVGQAGGRACVTVEKVAINLAEARIPDNDGAQPVDEPVRADGPTAYFSNLPVKAMVQQMQQAGIPAAVSYTAGTYVCNSTLYNLMYLIERGYPHVRGGFIHVPFENGQVIGKSSATPFMPVTMMTQALQAAISAAILCKEESNAAMGETH